MICCYWICVFLLDAFTHRGQHSVSQPEVWQSAKSAFILLESTLFSAPSFTTMVSLPAGCLLLDLWIDIIFSQRRNNQYTLCELLLIKCFSVDFGSESSLVMYKIGYSLSPSKLHYFSISFPVSFCLETYWMSISFWMFEYFPKGIQL